MITHHPSLFRASLPTLPAGLRGRTPYAFLSTAAASSSVLPPLRLRPLRAAAGGASPVAGNGGERATPPSIGDTVLGFVRSNFLPLGELPASTLSRSTQWDRSGAPGSYSWVPCSQIFPVKIQHLRDIPYLRTDSANQGVWCSVRSLACWTIWTRLDFAVCTFLCSVCYANSVFPSRIYHWVGHVLLHANNIISSAQLSCQKSYHESGGRSSTENSHSIVSGNLSRSSPEQ